MTFIVGKGEINLNRMFLKGSIVLAIVVMILGACSNNDSSDKKESSKEGSKVVATVNGEEISRADFETEMENTKATYAQQGMNIDEMDKEQQKEFEQVVLNQLINTKLVLQTAEEGKVSVEQKDIDGEIKNIKSQFEDEAKFKEALKEGKITEDELKEQVKTQLTVTKFLESKIGEIDVTEEELKAVYNQYKEAAELQKQEPEKFETMKPQLEQQAIAQKQGEKVNEVIEELRSSNEKNIKITL